MNELVVKEIIPSFYTGFDFVGYQNALERQKVIYIQTDRTTGKLNVGSAISKNMILLTRWKNYIDLIKLVNEKEIDYIKSNFIYLIIENYNEGVDDNYILK